MVIFIESLIGIILFTIIIVALTLKDPLTSVGDYPPAIRDRCMELGLIEKRKHVKSTAMAAVKHRTTCS